MKVYCIDCEYFERVMTSCGDVVCARCNVPHNIVDNYFKEGMGRIKTPKEKNIYNVCGDYKKREREDSLIGDLRSLGRYD